MFLAAPELPTQPRGPPQTNYSRSTARELRNTSEITASPARRSNVNRLIRSYKPGTLPTPLPFRTHQSSVEAHHRVMPNILDIKNPMPSTAPNDSTEQQPSMSPTVESRRSDGSNTEALGPFTDTLFYDTDLDRFLDAGGFDGLLGEERRSGIAVGGNQQDSSIGYMPTSGVEAFTSIGDQEGVNMLNREFFPMILICVSFPEFLMHFTLPKAHLSISGSICATVSGEGYTSPVRCDRALELYIKGLVPYCDCSQYSVALASSLQPPDARNWTEPLLPIPPARSSQSLIPWPAAARITHISGCCNPPDHISNIGISKLHIQLAWERISPPPPTPHIPVIFSFIYPRYLLLNIFSNLPSPSRVFLRLHSLQQRTHRPQSTPRPARTQHALRPQPPRLLRRRVHTLRVLE